LLSADYFLKQVITPVIGIGGKKRKSECAKSKGVLSICWGGDLGIYL
jgi:hypothetical protein